MTAKIEAGVGWMCKVHGSGDVQSEVPAAEMNKPIVVDHREKFSDLTLTIGEHLATVNVRPYDFHTEVGVALDIDSLDAAKPKLEVSAVEGIVHKMPRKVGGEAAAFVTVTDYFLSGNKAVLEFGQPGKPDYLKVAHEINQKGRLILG